MIMKTQYQKEKAKWYKKFTILSIPNGSKVKLKSHRYRLWSLRPLLWTMFQNRVSEGTTKNRSKALNKGWQFVIREKPVRANNRLWHGRKVCNLESNLALCLAVKCQYIYTYTHIPLKILIRHSYMFIIYQSPFQALFTNINTFITHNYPWEHRMVM